ncbi:hypothetical protein MXB_1641, partial [Myxobolus squamalis]
LESARAIKSGKLVRLSEQSIIDCSNKYGNQGCNGGYLINTFNYLMSNPISEESSYPYKGTQGPCRISIAGNQGQIERYVRVRKGNEDDLTMAIFNKGPVAISIDSRLDSFRFYKSGIYSDKSCSSTSLNHGVTAVGVISGANPHFIIKNSWGSSWGEGGYIRIARDKQNLCGVATDAVYPILSN